MHIPMQCTDSGTDVYIRVMDGDERVMQSLNRQQEGKYLFFTLYKQEKQSLVSGEGIHQEENGEKNIFVSWLKVAPK